MPASTRGWSSNFVGDGGVGPFQDLVDGDGLALFLVGRSRTDQVLDQEVDDLLRLGRAAVGVGSCLVGEGGLVVGSGLGFEGFIVRYAFGVQQCEVAVGRQGGGDRQAGQQHKRGGAEDDGCAVAAEKLASAVGGGGRAGGDGLVVEVAADVGDEGVGGLVAAVAVLFEALHDDPVELAADLSGRAGGGRCWRLAETVERVSPRELRRVLGRGGSSSRMIRRISSKAAVLERLRAEGGGAGEQLVEHDAEASRCRCGCRYRGR